jgi:putative CocE/NonD family hydrolase
VGPCDQREIEARDDVLVHSSGPLTEALEVIGRIRVRLVADSSAPVTDWVVRLCDVDADGTSRTVTDGVLRTRRAEDAAERVIDLWSTAHVFLPGHRVRVQVASSCFPRWDRSPASDQRVFHDSSRQSRVILPVRPRLS